MPYAITPQLTAFDTNHDPGDGICVFFYNSDYDFFPAGVGSSLGYSNYKGSAGFGNYNEPTSINGIRGAYVGVGFDIKGNFSNTTDGKTGLQIHDLQYNVGGTITTAVSTTPITTVSPNTICVRSSALSSYKILSTTQNLSTFPIQPSSRYSVSPPVTLHQQVSSRNDVVFHKIKVSLKNNATRLEVSIKAPDSDKFYPYQITDLDGTNVPSRLKAGLSFSTGESLLNCEIKNFAVYGSVTDATKVPDFDHLTPLSGVSLSAVSI
jgi:hypothetical protein